MTKSVSSTFTTHLQGDYLQVATIWRITRTDGEVFYFTDHDESVSFNGNTYNAPAGFERSAVANASGFAVDNVDLVGLFTEGEFEENEVRAGLFDGADIEISLVRWDDPDTHGEIKLRKGKIGEVKTTPQGFFIAEMRGLAQPLQQNTLALFSPHCRADLGDSECKFPIKPDLLERETAYSVGDFVRVETDEYGEGFGVHENRIYECTTAGTTDEYEPTFDTTIGNTTTDGTAVFTARDSFMRSPVLVDTVTTQRVFVVDSALDAFVDDHFKEGVLVWETGLNAGVGYEVKDWTNSTRTLELWEPVRLTVSAGDQFRIYPGCSKRVLEDCRDKFQISGSTNFASGNVKNFRGEPYVPGRGLLAIVPNSAGAR